MPSNRKAGFKEMKRALRFPTTAGGSKLGPLFHIYLCDMICVVLASSIVTTFVRTRQIAKIVMFFDRGMAG